MANDDDLDGFLVENSKTVAERKRKPIKQLDSTENVSAVKAAMQRMRRAKHDEEEDEDDEDNSILVRHPVSSKTRKLLEKGGAPRSAFLRAGSKIVLDESVQAISADLSKTKVRKISVAKQLKAFEKLQENPLWGSYLYVISSYPSDLRAKQIALSLMATATEQYYTKKTSNRVLLKRTPPIWHNVLSGFKDKLLDRDSLTGAPSMLVLSNVTEDASQHKMEKLRDIIVSHDNIPVIIVTSALDPVTFMLGKLKHHGDGFLYLGPDDKDTINA